jgi:hypothetical protein
MFIERIDDIKAVGIDGDQIIGQIYIITDEYKFHIDTSPEAVIAVWKATIDETEKFFRKEGNEKADDIMVVSNNKANIVKIWTRAEFDNFQQFFSKLSEK